MMPPASPHSEPTRAVLFDLDGTLVDSAPDLANALNKLRMERSLDPLELCTLRPVVGSGAKGLLKTGFGITPEHPEFEFLRTRFLELYALNLLEHTRPFPGIPKVLTQLQCAGVSWGIVTNKASRFAQPIVQGLPDLGNSQVLVCGDTTAFTKPHPEPLLHACQHLNVAPETVVYVGDDRRDVEAGRSAGMVTAIASWGYLGLEANITSWGADFTLNHPLDILKHISLV